MHAPKKPMKAVIADDDLTTRNALRLLLREHGIQVVAEAGDGDKAVELCDSNLPDLVFLDINMPKLDGLQVAETIRRRIPDIGIIMVSAVPTMDNVQKALQAGINGFIVKPFSAVKVMEVIENSMKRTSTAKPQ